MRFYVFNLPGNGFAYCLDVLYKQELHLFFGCDSF